MSGHGHGHGPGTVKDKDVGHYPEPVHVVKDDEYHLPAEHRKPLAEIKKDLGFKKFLEKHPKAAEEIYNAQSESVEKDDPSIDEEKRQEWYRVFENIQKAKKEAKKVLDEELKEVFDKELGFVIPASAYTKMEEAIEEMSDSEEGRKTIERFLGSREGAPIVEKEIASLEAIVSSKIHDIPGGWAGLDERIAALEDFQKKKAVSDGHEAKKSKLDAFIRRGKANERDLAYNEVVNAEGQIYKKFGLLVPLLDETLEYYKDLKLNKSKLDQLSTHNELASDRLYIMASYGFATTAFDEIKSALDKFRNEQISGVEAGKGPETPSNKDEAVKIMGEAETGFEELLAKMGGNAEATLIIQKIRRHVEIWQHEVLSKESRSSGKLDGLDVTRLKEVAAEIADFYKKFEAEQAVKDGKALFDKFINLDPKLQVNVAPHEPAKNAMKGAAKAIHLDEKVKAYFERRKKSLVEKGFPKNVAENYLVNFFESTDPADIEKARDALSERVGRQMMMEMEKIYSPDKGKEFSDISMPAMLKNIKEVIVAVGENASGKKEVKEKVLEALKLVHEDSTLDFHKRSFVLDLMVEVKGLKI